MQITYPDKSGITRLLTESHDNSLDFIVLVTAALNLADMDGLKTMLSDCARVLKKGGLLFVQGRPDYLPELGVYLDKGLIFKYWIALESTLQQRDKGLPSVHAGLLLFMKGNGRFNIGQVRRAHQSCAFCGKPLKDWGGKAHLMNPDGFVISDVWTDLPAGNNYSQLSGGILDIVLQLLDFKHQSSHQIVGLIGPSEGLALSRQLAETIAQYWLPGFREPVNKPRLIAREAEERLLNVIHCGDALETLRRYPDNSIDLVFADPPYNLQKGYDSYNDGQNNEAYIAWCNAWLKEYARILKPSGSLYVLNLPRWTMYHAVFLNQHLYFQNWIVWEALSEPRGKLMPAHYGLLWYTKHPTDFTFNYQAISPIDARYYCLRASCIRQRKAQGADDKMPLSDFWRDVHRIKHKRDRDHHPCQLPDALMERIIQLSTNEGDVVLDAMCGTGTTPVVAVKLGRQYVGIDLDERYVEISRQKVAEVEHNGFVKRKPIRKPTAKVTKKELQIELRLLAAQLGRLPTPEDVRRMSQYAPSVYLETFPTWGKALKAAKLEITHG
jgi:site-specific DNA-methyltransferase (adenine-specific)